MYVQLKKKSGNPGKKLQMGFKTEKINTSYFFLCSRALNGHLDQSLSM